MALSLISHLAIHGGQGVSAAGNTLSMSNAEDGAAELTRAGVIPVLLKVLNNFKDYTDEAGELQHLYAMYTVFNMSKFDFSRHALGANHDVIVCMEKMMSHRREIVRLMANFSTCLIAGRDEAGVGAELIRKSPEIVQETVDLLEEVLNAGPGGAVKDAVWEPDEIVIVLLSLSISDANKPLLVPAIPILLRCLEEKPDDAQLVEDVITTLLQLSFEPSTQELLIANKDDIEGHLEGCNKNENAEKSAKTLLTRLIPPEQKKAELVQLETRLAEMSVQASAGSSGKQVMISYNWTHQPVIKVIHKFLVSKGIKVWIDFEQMTGNIADKMAEAVETSDAVIMCVSSKYKESANCRQEAEYAVECKKPLVVCMMEQGYKANGWLGLLLGRKLWVNCMDGNNPDLDGILRELGALGIQ